MDYYVRYFGIDYKKTGRKLDELMKAKCVDVKTLSNTIGVSNQSVYKWIHGQTLPTLDNMYQISKLLNVAIDDIVVGMDEEVGYKLPLFYFREKSLIENEMII